MWLVGSLAAVAGLVVVVLALWSDPAPPRRPGRQVPDRTGRQQATVTDRAPAAPLDRIGLPLRADGDPARLPGPPVLDLPRRRLELSRRIAVMGIVNRTPDSFYDRGATYELGTALDHARRLVGEGADIIDVGGVKGGPGDTVSIADEIARVVPFVERFRAEHPDVLLSVDTFRAAVAEAALAAGADLVNDVTGLDDPELLTVVAAHDAGYVAMHHGGEPRTRPYRRAYRPDVTAAVVAHCRTLAQQAVDAGIDHRRIIVDPGHDFQKTTWHSLEVTRRLPELAALGYPVLVALSNKDFIGEALDAPLDARVDASLAAAVFSVLRGASIVRVHEVGRTVAALRMTESLLGWRAPAVAARGLE